MWKQREERTGPLKTVGSRELSAPRGKAQLALRDRHVRTGSQGYACENVCVGGGGGRPVNEICKISSTHGNENNNDHLPV